MRRLHKFTRRKTRSQSAAAENASRRGSTIVVVIALLLALTFLGIVGYTIGTQERGNAEYFADGSKDVSFGVSRDALFDWSLRQIILGTRLEERQSALHGGHMSLMATLFGGDLTPYTGQGVHLHMDGSGDIFVDQAYDGMEDPAEQVLIELNRAPFANGTGAALDQSNFPDPDVDYTYWDNNSPFLAYMNDNHLVRVGAGGGQTRKVVLPSYHRPQYLRSLERSDGIAPADWYTSPDTQRRVLRPHAEDRAVAANGTVTQTRRFIATAAEANSLGIDSGPFPFLSNRNAQTNNQDMNPANDGVWDGIWSGGRTEDNLVEYDADPDGDGTREAVWLDLDYPMQVRENPDGTVSKFVPLFGITIYDADALLNLNAHGNSSGLDSPADSNGNPLGTSFSNPFGRQRVGLGPDGRLGGGDDEFETRFISRSNQGVGVSEVNPQWGLYAGLSDGSLDQHRRFLAQYRDTEADPPEPTEPTGPTELANLEWWWLMTGRPELDNSSAVQSLHPGRYGEVDQLDAAFTSGDRPTRYPGPGRTFYGTPTPSAFFPGDSSDDNSSRYEGFSVNTPNGPFFEGNTNAFYNTNYRVFAQDVRFGARRTPLDFRGRGRFTVNGSNGQDRLLRQAGQHRFPSYAFYQDHLRLGLLSNDLSASSPNTNLMPGFLRRLDVDEPEETILVPSQARNDLDAIFGAGENATLHLSLADQDLLGLSGRLRSLAPVNFDGAGAEDRRSAFTTTSWDMKSFSKPRSTQTDPKFRNWEFSVDANRDGTIDSLEFPPSFGTTYDVVNDPMNGDDPFRPPVRDLLTIQAGNTGKYLQRKLSVNQLCDYEPATGRIRFRPLTPHPTSLPPERLQTSDSTQANFTTAPTRPEQIANADPAIQAANQEYLARRDRQQLCRDIYVLLYTFCEGSHSDVTSSDYYSSTPQVDSDGDGMADVSAELLQMAQFAVNVVDRMDPDDVATKFEFDIDLSDGWNLNDNPFDENESGNKLVSSTDDTNDRRVVYGVEAQELTLHEAQVVYAKRIFNNMSMSTEQHEGTQWDDESNQDFTYIELENVSPNIVDFANESWQVVVKPNIDKNDMSGTPLVNNFERRLVLNGGAPSVGVANNSRLLIGTAGEQDITSGGATNPNSHILVDENYDSMKTYDQNEPSDYTRVVPRISLQAGNALDLIREPNAYKIYDVQSDRYGDGDEVPPPPSTIPAGAELLSFGPIDPTNTDFIQESDDRNFDVTFELRRRLNPRRQRPPTNSDAVDNPWILVDTLTVKMDVFTLTSSNATKEDIIEQLTGRDPSEPMSTAYDNSFKSKERTEPLAKVPNGNGEHLYNVDDNPGAVIRNSLGIGNFNDAGEAVLNYQLYQTHLDRDYASISELLNVPLFSPNQLTQQTATAFIRATSGNQHIVDFNKNVLASARFLDQSGTGSQWQRLFEFLEVPDRSHQHYDREAYDNANGTYVRPPFVTDVESRYFYRRPGRINLNTVRHPQVLGGLLDDVEVIQPDNLLTDASGSGRRWWADFVQTRDGQDADLGDTNDMFLPGLPVSKPYRSLSFSAEDATSREHTVLRSQPNDPDEQLFEVTGSDDPTLRYQLLDKVMNNSTNRSNVFLIFVQVDFFEAVEVTDGMTGQNVVRVGGKLEDSPGYRGFFVVDRSKILEVLTDRAASDPTFDPSQDFLPSSFTDPADGGATKFNFSFNQNFDFHQLILHRQTIN